MPTQVKLDDGSVAQGIVVVKNDGTNAFANGRLPVQTDERPSASAAAITPSDTVALPGGTTRGVYVGGAGNVVALIGGAAVTFTEVPAGSILPVAATRVNATGTTATALVALF